MSEIRTIPFQVMLRSDGLRKVKSTSCGSETICVKVAVFKNIDPVTLAAER